MQIQRIPRWAWVLVALAAGFVLGQARRSAVGGDWVEWYGESIDDPEEFEHALTQDYHGVKRFKDLTVYPQEIDAAGPGEANPPGRQLVYVVSGNYFDGHPRAQGGRAVAEWKPRCFIARAPYRPSTGASRAAGATVMDYLRQLAPRGVTYSYAWWRHPRWVVAAWMAGSLLLVGVAWPTFVYLVAYGQLGRPKDEGVRVLQPKSSPVPGSNSALADVDLAAVDQLAARMEEDLAAGASAPEPPAPPPAAAPVAALAPAPGAGPFPSAEERERPEYGMKQDDYYPTGKVKGKQT